MRQVRKAHDPGSIRVTFDPGAFQEAVILKTGQEIGVKKRHVYQDAISLNTSAIHQQATCTNDDIAYVFTSGTFQLKIKRDLNAIHSVQYTTPDAGFQTKVLLSGMNESRGEEDRQ
jgi:hypothetical protein